jgi:hypothetical protein
MITLRWQQQPSSITTTMKKYLYNRLLYCTCTCKSGGMSSLLQVLVSTTTTKTATQRRLLATSKQKRKWIKEQGNNKPFMKKKYASILEKEATEGTSKTDTKITATSSSSTTATTNWRPFFFLGVFPILMSGIVVLSREDLREEVEKKGIGRFLKDFKNWRTLRALEHDNKMLILNNNLEQQQHDDHDETNNVNNNSNNSRRQDEETNNDAR